MSHNDIPRAVRTAPPARRPDPRLGPLPDARLVRDTAALGDPRPFDELVEEAEAAEVTGWGFGYLDGRATEERPAWAYHRLLAGRLGRASAALDIDTGGGEVYAEALTLAVRKPDRVEACEGWASNIPLATERLAPWGVTVHQTVLGAPLPVPDATFDLVSARHPVRAEFDEAFRVLTPGGTYLGQHVGPWSAWELIEFFLGPQGGGDGRDPKREVLAAQAAGLQVIDVRTARLRMEIYDIGAVVWLLRKCIWWVPDFSVDRYRGKLRKMDDLLRAKGPFVAHSTRHLLELRKPA